MTIPRADFLVIGGGIVGLTVALEARRRYTDATVTLLEKESSCGRHASGRNSGVLHAGFYYAADSLKARLTRDGNRELAAYCIERGLSVNPCGKLVVAREESELAGLDELARRGRANRIELQEVTAAEVGEIEPEARTHERALFSPTTCSIDPGQVMTALVRDAAAAGVRILSGRAYTGRDDEVVRTTGGPIIAGYVINAAGLYADRIARDFGQSEHYGILPFKGLYLCSGEGERRVRTHIYPVPDLRYPFLGVHLTVTAHGPVKVGPTAIPALWRENYGGLANFRLDELLEVGRAIGGLFLRNDFEFRRLATRELAKRGKRRLLAGASALLRRPLEPARWRWGSPGIRAQLVDLRRRELVMDFKYEGDDRSFHILNAVSPAFTCALPFARHVLDEIDRRLHGAVRDRDVLAGARA